MVVKEEQAVSSSFIVNLYTDIEYLLAYAGRYKASYSKVKRILEKERKEKGDYTTDNIPANEQSALVTLTDTIRIQAYKVYMRLKAITDKLNITTPKDFETHFNAIWDKLILDPEALDTLVQDLMQIVSERAFSDAVLRASQTIKGLGG